MTDAAGSEREARERLAEMADAMPQLVWRARADGVPDYYNARVAEFDGFSRDPATGEWNWSPCLHPDDLARTAAAWSRAVEAGEPYRCEHRIRVKGGEYRWMLSRAEPVRDAGGRVVRWYGTATDIDGLKSAEAALRESQARLGDALRAGRAGTWDWDLASGRLSWSAEVFELFGVDPASGEPDYARWRGLINADDLANVEASLRTLLASGGETVHYEFRLADTTRGERWILAAGRVLRDASGEPVRMSGINLEITERKLVERALLVANDMLEHLVELSPFGVYIVDADFRLVRVSEGARSTFRNVGPLLGKDFAQVLRAVWTEPFASQAIALFRHTLATGEPYHALSTRERRADDGQVESYDWKIERITLPDGRYGVVCHFYDLSERAAFEEALKQNRAELELELLRRGEEIKRMLTQSVMLDRMAAVGTLAAGLGHDLGNLLLPISVSAETLRRTATGPAQTEAAESIMRSMEYVRSLVRGLRLFTLGSEQGRAAGPPRTDPEDWARQTSPFLSHAAASGGSGARLEMHAEPGTPALAIDPAALSQAVLNLVQNAADALQEPPASHPGSSPGVPAAPRLIRVHVSGVPGSRTVRVVVEDNGPGMSPEVLARCTEPYFTTKTRGVRTGTGLGLALVHETARRCAGSLSVSSVEGQGTRVTLEIPAAPAGGANAGRPVAAVELSDPAWRKLGSSLLAASGFSVYEVDGAGIPPDSAILVTDRPHARAGELSRLSRRGGAGRVVVVGAQGEVDSASGAVAIAPDGRPVELVRAIRGAILAARAGTERRSGS